MSADTDEGLPVERRQIQRIFTSGVSDASFTCLINGERWRLLDLSLAGFALPVEAVHQDAPFSLELMCSGKQESMQLTARAVNHLNLPEGSQVGCLFVGLDEEQAALLQTWLVEYVLRNASVPIDAADAVRIVTGPSLV